MSAFSQLQPMLGRALKNVAALTTNCLQAYVRKQAQCLLDIEADSGNDSPALTQLCRWTMEVTAILICFGFGNAKNLEVLHSLNMADGSLSHEAPPDNANESLLVRQDSNCLALIKRHSLFCIYSCVC